MDTHAFFEGVASRVKEASFRQGYADQRGADMAVLDPETGGFNTDYTNVIRKLTGGETEKHTPTGFWNNVKYYGGRAVGAMESINPYRLFSDPFAKEMSKRSGGVFTKGYFNGVNTNYLRLPFYGIQEASKWSNNNPGAATGLALGAAALGVGGAGSMAIDSMNRHKGAIGGNNGGNQLQPQFQPQQPQKPVTPPNPANPGAPAPFAGSSGNSFTPYYKS